MRFESSETLDTSYSRFNGWHPELWPIHDLRAPMRDEEGFVVSTCAWSSGFLYRFRRIHLSLYIWHTCSQRQNESNRKWSRWEGPWARVSPVFAIWREGVFVSISKLNKLQIYRLIINSSHVLLFVCHTHSKMFFEQETSENTFKDNR